MILDPSSLISSLFVSPCSLCHLWVYQEHRTGQNCSEEKTNQADFQVTSFTMLEPKIEQETLAVLTWKIQSLLGWDLWYGTFQHMLFVMKYLQLKMTQSNFFQPDKRFHLYNSALARYWAWKINAVSPQELRGGLDKVIFWLISITTFFFPPCLLKYAWTI